MKHIKTFLFLYSFFLTGFLYPKIKVYSFFTESHKELVYDWFLPSLPSSCELILEEFPQECVSGEYMSSGWVKTMIRKVDLIIRGIEENWGGIFVHADIDIQFFKGFEEDIQKLMENKDIIAQKGSAAGRLCAGFFACRGNKKTLALWKEIRRIIEKLGDKTNDEIQFNNLIRGHNKYKVKWGLLPKVYFCPGYDKSEIWKPGQKLDVPHDIILHHANWTVGISNKIKQLEYVKEKIQKLVE